MKTKLTDFFVQDDLVLVRPLTLEDRDFYCHIRAQHSMIVRTILSQVKDGGLKMFQEDVLSDYSFSCGVEDITKRVKVGYMGIHDLRKPVWEIAIELDDAYVHQGYGSHVLPLFLNELWRVTGNAEYRARVDADNIASQGCMGKIGAKLIGICDGIVPMTDADRERMEERFLYLIDDHIRKLAETIGVEPRKLLSHSLEYRLTCPLQSH